MELPQPRPLGTEGRKPTHDFLSLYSPIQQDPKPSQGSGFSLWEESVAKKGKTRKENVAEDTHAIRDSGVKIGGQWTPSERHSQSFSSNHCNNTTFSSLSSSQPSSWQKNQSFIDIIKSAGAHEEEDEDDEEFVFKKEPSSLYRVKADGKGTDQRANTPRSKHSATEQRRRSKINDRFQTLREIIPNSDQRRDKASFLLGVIEYIQFLQERVQKYEGSYQEWNHDPAKLMALRNSQRPSEIYVDKSRETALMFETKFGENNVTVSPTIPRNQQNPAEYDMSTGTTFKAMENHHGLTTKAVPLPISMSPNMLNPGRISGAAAPLGPTLASDAENSPSQPQCQSFQSRLRTTDCAVLSDKLKEQELTIESGTISISSVYSQGLLNTLTQALHSSGVDLSQASISVQIELAKQANSSPRAPTSIAKEDDGSDGDESDQALKRLKTSKN